jgi:hypothetical protein
MAVQPHALPLSRMGSGRVVEAYQTILPRRCYGQQQGSTMQIPGSIQRFLKGLGPYQSLSILAVP